MKWCRVQAREHADDELNAIVACFSIEFCIRESIPLSVGGLGILKDGSRV